MKTLVFDSFYVAYLNSFYVAYVLNILCCIFKAKGLGVFWLFLPAEGLLPCIPQARLPQTWFARGEGVTSSSKGHCTAMNVPTNFYATVSPAQRKTFLCSSESVRNISSGKHLKMKPMFLFRKQCRLVRYFV